MAADLGPFAGLLGTAGCAISAGTALITTWSGGANWAPQDEGMLKGPGRIAGLTSTALVVILWVGTRPAGPYPYLPNLALVAAMLTIGAFLAYQFLTSTLTYDDRSYPKKPRKMIGGFRIKASARHAMAEQDKSPQQFLDGADYDPEEVWTPTSIAAARVALLLTYLLLLISGTVALASVALLVEKSLA